MVRPPCIGPGWRLCLALVLLECTPPPPGTQCVPASDGVGFGGGFGTGGGTGAEPVFFTGQVAELSLESFTAAVCEPRWTVQGEVLDPQNRPVPAEFVPSQGVGSLVRTRVRFTPRAPGSYLVTAQFEPSIARVQRVVLVARDRSAETPITDALPFDPRLCIPVFRTLAGSVVCQRNVTVVVVRNGSILESFPDTTANVVGNTVWLLTTQRLERRVDTGVGPLTLTGTMAATRFFSSNASFFDADRAIVLDNWSLRGPIVFDGARLVDEARPFLGGKGLLLGAAALSFDGDSVCDASADAGVCARLTPIGVQEDVLWTQAGRNLSFRAGRQAAPAAVFAFTLGPADAVDPLDFPISGNQTPRVRSTSGDQLFTITFVAGEPVLERWPSSTQFTRDFGLVGTTAASANWLRR